MPFNAITLGISSLRNLPKLSEEARHILALMDDGAHTEPTRENILAAYQKLVDEAEPGDAVFCHYSGTWTYPHGAMRSSLLLPY